MLILAFVFVGRVFAPLFSVPSLIFWFRWPRVLVTIISLGPGGCLWSLQCLDPTSPPVKMKFSSETVDKNMEPSRGVMFF